MDSLMDALTNVVAVLILVLILVQAPFLFPQPLLPRQFPTLNAA